ncbi:MAG: YMGG-like glycine zipper-containing protein, partial [Gemmatimonadales bacterium]
VALGLSACVSKKDDTLAQDTSLNRDLQMANADTSAQPALKDVPAGTVAPAPVTTAPAAPTRARTSSGGTVVRTPTRRVIAPAAPTTTTTSSGNTVTRTSGGGSEAAVGMIAAGSTLNLASNSRICTNTNRVGQRFTATVSETVTGSNGATIPAGATANVEITELNRSENANDKVVMGFRVVSVSFGGRTYPVSATTTYANVDRVKNQPKDKDVQKVVGGAAIGAILGQVIGHSTKGTVIGAAAGAAAGTAAAAATSNYEGCVPDGGRITVSLDSPVQVRA